jgi:long-chain-fatty-acid---luciferin-component ligase
MLNFTDLKTLSFIDDLIYQNDECYHLPVDHINEIQTSLIIDAFRYHYNNCSAYTTYCKALGIGPNDIVKSEDLCKIPLIPSILFKEYDIMSCSPDEIVKVCTSSGTRGSISKVYRDEVTLDRFMGSVQCCLDQIMNLDDAYCINLGPTTEEAGDLWFSYAMSLVDMIYPTEYFVINDIFYAEKAYKRILEEKNKYENIIIIGAPIMFLEFVNYLKQNNLKIESCENFYFLTAGGWKRFSGQQIPRPEFISLMQEYFINSSEKYFRDILNMVELNTVLPECEAKVKHLPPWVKVLILDPINLKPVKDLEYQPYIKNQ